MVGASKPLIRPETLVVDDIINDGGSNFLMNLAFWGISAGPEYPNCSDSINVEGDITFVIMESRPTFVENHTSTYSDHLYAASQHNCHVPSDETHIFNIIGMFNT